MIVMEAVHANKGPSACIEVHYAEASPPSLNGQKLAQLPCFPVKLPHLKIHGFACSCTAWQTWLLAATQNAQWSMLEHDGACWSMTEHDGA